ncbi:MAG: AMP-binding protein [Bacteroidales bacterium]|nr:AMP-binding protein [Bacteroidales bacterium]
MNVFDWFGKWAIYNPLKIAFKEFETGREYSYAQFNKLGNNLAGMLSKEQGFAKGDRFAIISEFSMEYVVLFALAQKTGIILVPLNYRLAPDELNYIISNAEVAGIFYDEKFLDKIKNLESFQKIAFKLSMDNLADINKVCIKNKFEPPAIVSEIKEDDPMFILYTSGTTAFPKGAIYTHKMLFWNSINTELRLNITSNDVSINCAPPFHTGGWNVLLTPFIHHGAYTLLIKSFDPDLVLEMLDHEHSTIWWAVPTMLKMMAESPVFNKVKLSRLRYFIVGGEAMPIPLIEQWHDKGVLIRQGYGLTEAGPNVTSLDHQDAIRKKGSIGTLNFYYHAKLVDENFKEVAMGKPGEFVLAGPTVTPGYWKNPDESAKAIQSGWFHTGDLMIRDKEGYYFVVDRIKNMYISGGENVYPAEVEHVLGQHPAISSLAIVGVPDTKWGETGKAFVVLNPGIHISKDEILNYCISKLAKYKVPKHIEFLEELPQNDAGKIDRKKLKEMV